MGDRARRSIRPALQRRDGAASNHDEIARSGLPLEGTMSRSRGSEGHSRSLVKAVTWRVTASLDTFVISFILTGRLVLAGSIAGTELLTKILLYYFHERIWALIPWGRR